MNRSNLVRRALVASTLLALAATAHADVTVAKKCKLHGVVTIKGKAANSTLTVYQSDAVGGGDYVDTGYEIETDENGDGTVHIPNIYSGRLLVGHIIKVGDNTRTVAKGGWFMADVVPGDQTLQGFVLEQATVDETTLLESWDPGSLWALQLDPFEASWYDAGVQILCEGDLQAQLVHMDSQQIVIQILNDPTQFVPDNIQLHGVGLHVQPGIQALHPQIALHGSCSAYLDGNLIGAIQAPAPVFAPVDPIAVGQPCLADWNGDGLVNTGDFLAYLNDYNAVQNGQAPTFGDPDIAPPFGALNTGDLLEFLNSFVGGC